MSAKTDQWAREIVIQAWDKLGKTPSLAELQYTQAVGRFEGYYGLASVPEVWKGSNNWGAVQCGHGAPCGDNCFETKDTDRNGKTYTWCYRKYASPLEGAKHYISILTRDPNPERGDKFEKNTFRNLVRRGNILNVTTFTHKLKEDGGMHYHDAKPEKYGTKVWENAQIIAKNLNEPLALAYDKDVTSKGIVSKNQIQRMSASRAGIQRALDLKRKLSTYDKSVINAASGSIIVTADEMESYMGRVDAKMRSLDADIERGFFGIDNPEPTKDDEIKIAKKGVAAYADRISGKFKPVIRQEFLDSWKQFYFRWIDFRQNASTLWSSTYEETENWDRDYQKWREAYIKESGLQPTAPNTPPPNPEDRNSTIKTVAIASAVVVAGIAVISFSGKVG